MIKINGLLVEPTFFPNKELNLAPIEQAILATPIGDLTIKFKYRNDVDLVELLLVSQLPALKQFPSVNLDIMYMPYARMDRGGYSSSSCALRTVAGLISKMGFDHIHVCDPHSDLTLAYLGTNATAYYPFETWGFNKDTIIMFPDSGAQKRYAGMSCFSHNEQIVGNKVRDFKTGKIVSYEVSNGKAVAGKVVVIVDDLCSYGGTFKLAGDELVKFGPERIELMVSHCEESINSGKLFDADSPITYIWTTNSIIEQGTNPKLHIDRIF